MASTTSLPNNRSSHSSLRFFWVTAGTATWRAEFSQKQEDTPFDVNPPSTSGYRRPRPGGCLSTDCSRRDHTTLTRFLSGHIRSLTFSDNSKCFEVCPKCTAEQDTPDHILACLGLSHQDLVSNPLLTLAFFRVHRLMDLV
ncbi:hypothetical protein AVEN_165055-1 [Araneus ventricosus]|uniref:Uncharacterized protein n=1 Tax=Araneus ventricosus TaxID=182803 RepID=A0A4Y2KPA1_ARAVE|nr:hypothetical protein AVEN_165055-1 [Araneus ventricosus]